MTINYNLLSSSEIINYLKKITDRFNDLVEEHLRNQSVWLGKVVKFPMEDISTIPIALRTFLQVHHTTQDGLYSLNARNDTDIPDQITTFFHKTTQLHEKLLTIVPLETELALVKNFGFLDPNQLMKAVDETRGFLPLIEKEYEWDLNLALLMNVYQGTKRVDIKRKIGFLALNYLFHNAPIYTGENSSNMGIFDEDSNYQYHRFSLKMDKLLFNFNVAPRLTDLCNSAIDESDKETKILCDIFLLEREEIRSLWPLFFDLIDAPSDHNPLNYDKLEQRIHQTASTELLSAPMEELLIMDLTPLLKDLIIVDNDPVKYKKFEQKILEIRYQVEELLKRLIKPYAYRYSTEQIVEYFKLNICYVCQFVMNGTQFLIKIPIFRYNTILYYNHPNLLDDIDLHHHKKLKEFIKRTGIGLGAVKCRQQLFNFVSIDTLFMKRFYGERRLIEYTGKEKMFFILFPPPIC